MPVFGLNNGVVPIVAYNYGAQNRRRMMETIKRSAIYASCIMVLGMAIFWAIPGTLVSIFNATETMKQVAVPALRIISLSFCTAGACIALGSSFQALGKSVYSMITSIIRQLVFLVPIAYVLARYGQSIGNDDLVWWCYPIAEIASLGVTMLFFLRGVSYRHRQGAAGRRSLAGGAGAGGGAVKYSSIKGGGRRSAAFAASFSG